MIPVTAGTAAARTGPADPAPDRRAAPGPAAGAGPEFEVFVREHLPRLLAHAVVLTGDRHLAADVVQSAVVRAHGRWELVRRAARPDRYVSRIVTNEYLTWRRRWHVRTVVPVTADVLTARAHHVADHAERVVERDHVRRLLEGLPRRQRTVLALRYYGGLADAEIADLLRTAPGTVRATASRALAALRADAGPTRDPR